MKKKDSIVVYEGKTLYSLKNFSSGRDTIETQVVLAFY